MKAALLLLIAAFPAWSAELSGRVVGITDGDTITVLAAGNIQEKIRLAGIDAPEKAQPYGQASKQALSDQAYDRQVIVDWTKRDRYGRIVGKVMIGGSDANLGQVRRGLAWHYKQYAAEQAPADREAYAAAEVEARRSGIGLWADRDPIQPWEWRKAKRGR